ncbi:PIR Superfamily Protein [Plasmodium ovale wallikeri]|uniref:PIR Superfamily Protein n=1 Tax=Plasmodium ovale wallikeri TaxID=864142 RepID=A0A1A9A8B8_PLAOA|nr:PIR Superfamily Protein [Plasmodium ovale wallikeri]SBT55409.1 PIR Superfamily Protein [Plasmodium ovale wallikeri]
MAHDIVSREESYGFFERIDIYMPQAASAEKKNIRIDQEDICKSFLSDNFFKYISYPPDFCVQFKHLYDLLLNRTITGKTSESLDNKDCAFINYWLNDKLRGINIDNSICVNEFYKQIKAKNNEIFKDELLNKKLHNIEKHELENMRKLYDLYNIKDKISSVIADESTAQGVSCLGYTKECYRKYKEAIISCRGDCLYFYSLIKEFKTKYKNDLSHFAKSSFSCKSEELFELPNYGVVLKEHESVRIIRNGTLSLLLPVLGVFLMFKFSDKLMPVGQYILEKLKSRKNMFGEGERDNELLSYTSDDDSSIFNDGEYNISYYNVRNY